VSTDYHAANRGNVSQFDKNDSDTLVGVIARSAGVWDSKCFSHLSPALEDYFFAVKPC
jgi:hypothetical protein